MSKQEIHNDKGQIKEFIRANKMYIANGCSMNDFNKAMEMFSIDNKGLWNLIYQVRDEVAKEQGVSENTPGNVKKVGKLATAEEVGKGSDENRLRF